MDLRDAEPVDIDSLTRLWHDGWHEAHAPIVPVEITRLRTLEFFRSILEASLPSVRVTGQLCTPAGLCIVKGDELNHLYVSAQSRGTGVAAALIADAEVRLGDHGVQIAWLACAIGNLRAARFYEKSGWNRIGIMVYQVETPAGMFPLEVWRYEKSLVGHRPASR
jgi:GNAT superfamily N-acetyltransferase